MPRGAKASAARYSSRTAATTVRPAFKSCENVSESGHKMLGKGKKNVNCRWEFYYKIVSFITIGGYILALLSA